MDDDGLIAVGFWLTTASAWAENGHKNPIGVGRDRRVGGYGSMRLKV